MAQPRSGEQLQFFEQRIRPLLIERCYECHSGDRHEGGLRLDVADALSRGGESGAVVVPGDPQASLLVAAVHYEELEMPPAAPLSDRERSDLVRWVAEGAVWPVTSTRAARLDDAPWWAAEPLDPGAPPLPVAAIDSPTTIDRYIDDALDRQGLRRAPPAAPAKQLRRLSYDLLGLPPSPAAVERYLSDPSPAAYRRLVDAWFADPAYGERMARLWLDLVRYAESDGWRADAHRPGAWRYRQFVTAAFNQKLPYDQFVAWQIAGDEIAPGDPQALAAVGFLRLGIYEYNQRDAEGQWENIVDELTDVTADVFLATGLACAKCHDHKFDPIPRADYFRLRSVFEPLLFVDRQRLASRDEAAQGRVDALLAELAAVQGDAVEDIREFVVDRFPLSAQAMYHTPPAERNSYQHQIAYLMERQVAEEGLKGNRLKEKIGEERFQRWQQIRAELRQLEADPYGPARWLTVQDTAGAIRPTRLPGRPAGPTFAPAVPQVFGGQPLPVAPPNDAPTSSGRRSALARWITRPDNPIAARVIVNRLWQYHFGTGLVASPNDFGRLGSPPSHPHLLDYLATRLIDSGWNLQVVQREIVLSATYRQATVHPDADGAMAIDADNRGWWHQTVRRLDAEQFRDSLLVATDQLVDQVGGPSIAGTGPRRSLYLQRFRNRPDEMLAALDAPPGVVGTAKRDQTTTATQALMMLNHPRMNGVAKAFAERVRRDLQAADTGSEQDFAEPASGRPESADGLMPPPEDAVSKDAVAFVSRAYRILKSEPAPQALLDLLAPVAAQGSHGQQDVCHVLINSNDFLYLD